MHDHCAQTPPHKIGLMVVTIGESVGVCKYGLIKQKALTELISAPGPTLDASRQRKASSISCINLSDVVTLNCDLDTESL